MKSGKKRLLSIILCGSLIAALLPMGVLAEMDDSVEDEFAIEEVVPDEGTSDVPEEETVPEGSDVSAAEGTGEEISMDESSESSDTDAGSLPEESGDTVVEGTVEEIPLDTITYEAEEEGLLVEVTTSDDAFPDGGEVELHVALFEEDSDEYREAAEAIDYAEDDARGMAALDLFFTVDGVETEPAAPVQVKIDLSELLPENADTGSLEVQHLEEKRFGRVKSVVVATAEENDEVEGTIDEETAVAEFELESFSKFTVTWTWEGGSTTSYTPHLEVTVYLDDVEMDGFADITFDTVDYELDLMTLLDTNMLEGEGDHTFEYAYLTYTSNGGTVTLGSEDHSIIAIEIEDGHGSPDGNYFRIIYADGTYTTEVPADDNNSANVSLFVYYTTPDPAVEITSVDQDIYGDWLVQANLKHVGNYATVTYDWKVVDADGNESNLAYVDRADSVGGAYIVWHTDLVESGSVVYVEVTATVTYEDGSTLDLTDTHELDYGLEVVTLAVTYGADSNAQPVPAGVEVTLSHQVYEDAVYTYTTDESGTITGSFVQGVYDVEAEATIDGQHYSYSGTITIDASGTYTINLMEDDAGTDSGQLPEKDDWNHIDIKLSASSSSYGVSSGATEFTITSVIITDEKGNQKYVATQESIDAGENMTEFKITFYEVQADGSLSAEASHTIEFSSGDTIIIGYDIWYESTDSTMSYTVKITQDTAYPHGTAYPATGERAYKLYNYLYGTNYQSDAELLAAGVTEIDISGMSILLVGAILCDSSEVTGSGQVTGTEGMWGFDFTMSPEAFAILGNTWVCDLEKTYLNHELTEKEFYFYFVDGDYDETTGYWSLDDEYWYYELYNGTVIRGIDGNASDTLPGIYVTFDDSRFWYDESREDSSLFQYDADGNLIVDDTYGLPVDADGKIIENKQHYGQHHYYILAEQPGEDPYTLYDGTVFGIDVWTYADDPYDMNSEAHIVGTYYLLTLVDGEWTSELDLNWTGELYTGNTKVTLDETEDNYPTFHFVNEYVDYLLLYKEDANRRSVSGAKFTLIQEAEDDGGAFAYYYYDPYLEAAEPWVYIGKELTGSETLTAFELGDLTITNDDGEEVEVCGMKLSSPYDGRYYLTEVEAPGGYALLPAGIVFTVKDYRIFSVNWVADYEGDEDISDYVFLPLDSYNYELYLIDPYSVRIYKRDENGKSIAGAKFTLTLEAKNDAGDTTGYYYYSYDEETGVGSWIEYNPSDDSVVFTEFEFVELTETYVDENGVTQSMTVHGFDLDSPLNGTYTLTEVSAPGGVTLIPYGISFALDTGRIVEDSFGWAEGYEGDENIEDYVSLGQPNEGEENSWQLYAEDPDVIRLYKVDMEGNALDGAYFTLTRTEADGSTSYYDPSNTSGPWVKYTGETEIPAGAFGEMQENAEDESGNETIETVYGWELDSPVNGTYVLTEVTAPYGYELLPGAVTFTVENYRIVEDSVAWADDSVTAILSDYVTVGDEEENWQLILADEAVFSFDLEKVDEDGKQLDGATFTLYSDEACANALGFVYDKATSTYTLSDDPMADGYTETIFAGSVTIAGIEEGTYYMLENAAPDGYIHLSEKITVTVTAGETTGSANVGVDGATHHVYVSEDNTKIFVQNDSTGTTRIDVEKVWDDADNQDGVRPDSITVTLLADNEETGKTLTLNEANSWSGSFTNLPVYQSDDNGEDTDIEISYGISESFDVTYHSDYDGTYSTTYSGEESNGYLVYDEDTGKYSVIITNSYTPETTRISGMKVWDDEENQYNRRPTSITVNLLANGIKIDELTVTADASGDWSWAFTELPKYENGTEILYTFTEDRVDEYDTTYSADTLTITNTFNPGTVSVTVNKAWNDDESYNHRPESIEVELLADGVETDQTLTLSEDNSWTGSFTGLDKYNTSGVEVVYTVAEITDEALKYYLPKISGSAEEGYTIMNQRRYFPIDEEIVVDEDDRGSWVKNEAVNEYNAIEIEMSTYLPLIDPTEVADGDFVMNFHEVLDYELTLDELDGDFSVYINNQKISHDYYVITTASTASPTGIQPYAMGGAITDGCSFHADVDLSALYRDGVIGDDDFLGDTEIMIYFYADLEGTGLNGTYKSTVWYEVYDGDTLEYTSNVDVVYVYTYEIEIIKYDASTLSGTDYAGSALAGATLGIYYDVTCENPVYRSPGIGSDESERQPYTVTSGDDGYAMFYGLADGTYYIRETEAPDGYQLSNEVLTVTLDSSLQNTNYTYEAAGYANSPEGWEPPIEEEGPPTWITTIRTKTSDVNTLTLWLILAAAGALFAVAGGVLAGKRRGKRS